MTRAGKTSGALQHFLLDGRSYTVDPQAKLGQGSEGVVYGHPNDADLCIKLYHEPDHDDVKAQKIARYRSRKIESVTATNFHLPSRIILPQLPLHNPGNRQTIGFQMRRVPAKYVKLMQLLDSNFRTSQQVGLRFVVEMFADLFDDLRTIHANGMVVGDINMGSVMFNPKGGLAWVDTDSWRYPGFDCLATTELFAHPDLYPNVTSGSTAPAVDHEPRHDLFGFLVAFTMLAIPGAHPFAMGTHPVYASAQDRAKARVTIFDDDVTPPAMIGSPEILSDELLKAIIERLKRHIETGLDTAMLREFAQQVTTCNSCRTEYHSSRQNCPKCRTMTVVQAARLLDFVINEVFKANGTVLFCQLVGDNVFVVCRVGDSVQVIRLGQSGQPAVLTPSLPNVPGARYRFFADCLVVCPDPAMPAPVTLDLYTLQGNTLSRMAQTTSGALENESAVFDTSGKFLYRMAGNALVRTVPYGTGGALADTQIGTVYQRQSWFTADHSTGENREALVGFDRALQSWSWFVMLGNSSGSRYQYHEVGDLEVELKEVIEDYAVYFSASSALIVLHTSLHGREYVRYAVVGFDGKVHINKRLDAGDPSFVHWRYIRGKLHQGKSVLHVTPDGVVKQDLTNGVCTTLKDTVGRVDHQDYLMRLTGKVGIVRRSGIAAMTRKK